MTSPVTTLAPRQQPDFWNIWGHSYVQLSYATLHTTGRFDSLFGGALDTEANNRRNYARDGACLVRGIRNQGGYNRVQQDMTTDRTVGPYVSDTGAHLMVWGINDLGIFGGGTQLRDAWKHNLRGVISRVRASAVFENDHASCTYGAGFVATSPTTDFSSGTSTRHATTMTAATITITIPADYRGETIAISFVTQSGAWGGTITFSGTAGVTGTLSISSQAAVGQNGMAVKRAVAPVTGATQTIICTLTQLDGGGDVHFDCWWIEAGQPPPVLVCNVAKLTATGYALYGGWAGTEGQKDTDVDNLNADTRAVVAEFDSMVQIVDLDAALGKNAVLMPDGLHPNEVGAAACAQACLDAVRRLVPVGPFANNVANLNPSSDRGGQLRRSRIRGLWYTADCRGFGTNYTAVSGDLFYLPFYVTGSRERWTQFQVEALNSITGTTIRWGIYGDRKEYGYPQDLIFELTTAGAFTITSGIGVKPSPASPAGGSPNNIAMDPGLYWLALKFCAIGVAHTFRTCAGPSLQLPNCATTGAGSIAPAGWKLAAQGTTALPATAIGTPFATATLSDNVPAVFVKLF